MSNTCDYCNYIINKYSTDSIMLRDDKEKKELSQAEFLRKANLNIENQNKYIKEFAKVQIYDLIAIETLDCFFHKKMLFLSLEPSIDILKIYNHSKSQFLDEKKKLKNGDPVSFDNLFEILYNISLIIINALNAFRENKEKIELDEIRVSSENIYTSYASFFGHCTKRKFGDLVKNVSAKSAVYAISIIVESLSNMLSNKYSTYQCTYTNVCRHKEIEKSRDEVLKQIEKLRYEEKQLLKLRYDYFMLMISATCFIIDKQY